MERLLSCEFNMDTACVEVKFADGSMISIDTIAVENEVADNMYQRSELDWLIYNKPLEYVQLVLVGDLEGYLRGTPEHGKVLKVCFLMMTGWIFLCAYAQKATIGMREYLVGTEVSANYWDSFFNYYPVVFPLIIFCSYYFSNDFRQGTVKHYIEKGLSRWSYFLSKLVIGWIVSFFFLVSAFLIGLLCNKIFFGISGLTFTNIRNIVSYIFCEALYHMAVSTLAISLVFLIRNSSVSMAVNALLIFFGYLVLHGLESILGLGYNITIFWAISNINKTRIDMAVQWLPTAIIIFFAYMIIFGGVIGTIFKKRDIT